MNRITITGRIVADAELRFTTAGEGILNFRVADDVGYGEKKTTNWWNCSIFGKRATDNFKQWLVKGQQVTVFGQVVLREWVNKDGIKQLSTDIRVDEVELQGSRNEPSQAKPPARPDANSGRGDSGVSQINQSTSRLAQMDDNPF